MTGRGRIAGVARTLGLCALALSAAVPASAPAATDSTITLCHATGVEGVPYVVAVVPADDRLGHDEHPGDIIPAPPGGCPATVQVQATPTATPAPSQLTLCHAEGAGRRYVALTVTPAGLREHRAHPNDLIPAPAAGCPRPASLPAVSAPRTQRRARRNTPAARRPAARREAAASAAGESGAQAAPARATASDAVAVRVSGQLPWTGVETWLVMACGLGFLLTGTGLRLLTGLRGHRAL